MITTRAMPWQRAGGRAAQRRPAGRVPVRLWALLHAPALLRGCPGAPGEAVLIEDDRRRLGHRQPG